MLAIFNTPLKRSILTDVAKEKKSRKRGSFPERIAFKVGGERFNIQECLERTRMDEKGFRKKYTRIVSNQREPTWEMFK